MLAGSHAIQEPSGLQKLVRTLKECPAVFFGHAVQH